MNDYFTNKILSSKLSIIAVIITLAAVIPVHAQITDSAAVQPDSALIQPDSLQAGAAQDTVPAAGLAAPKNSGALQEGEVYFQSKDSLVFNFREDRVANLYNAAEVIHSSGKLESGKVKLNLDKSLVSAATPTPQDTLTQPVLTRQGQPPLRSKSISFNYQTEKGRFEVARVEIPKGKITGTVVKKVSRHVVFLEDAIYSTCTLPHPHYYIKADQMKIVDQEEIFFRNARLYILDIPYPLVFPFGYLPRSLEERQSGLLQPTYVYQNTSSRGLGLRNVGWFQYFSDYIVGQAAVDIYTSGTFYLDTGLNYQKRDSFSGGIQLGYSLDRGMEPTDPDFQERVEKSLSINHNQQFSPYSTISADINLRTADFFQRNSYDIDERAQTTTRSSINYRYQHPNDFYNFSIGINQSRDFESNVTNISGPSFDFNLKRLSPFANEISGTQNRRWYENISLQYGNAFESGFQYDPIRENSARIGWFEALLSPSKYRQATGQSDHYKYGFQQNLTISFGNLWPGQFINLTAGGNYTEFWYPSTIRQTFNADSNAVETEQIRGFAAAREFSTSLSASTTIYGISTVNIRNIEGFRHTVRPNISFSYRPDFTSNVFGYFREVQVDTSGRTREYSIFEDAVIGGPAGGEQRSLNFGISNTFEAKVVKRDSTGEVDENIIRIIDRFSLNSSYNFAADSLKLSNLNTSLTSNIVEGVNIRASANFNFYERNEQGIRVDNFLLNSGKIAELVDFSLSASTSFSGGDGGIRINEDPYFPARYDPLNQSIFKTMDPNFNRIPVQPFESPWSIDINFRYSWSLNPTGDNARTATLNAQQIQFRLTPKWSFSTRLGYDFIQKELTPSKFSLTRQLHLWNLSFEMSPFGDFQYYFFRLSINSSALQSIFQKLPLLKNLERSSSPTGAGVRSYR